jgi:DNA-binding NarL/FixJ family response regulator
MVPNSIVNRPDDHRSMLADYLKLLSWWMGRPPTPALPPRLEATLLCLLRGLSEKELARELSLSPATAHEYVKQLYQRLGVTSRGELLARFLPNRPTPTQAIQPDRP